MELDVTVREVMDDAYVGVSESDGVLETVELLLNEGAAVAIALQGSEVVGVCTERDVLAMLVRGEEPDATTVGDVMTASVPTIRSDRTLAEARDRMMTEGTRWLVVVDGDEPRGVVTEHDLLVGTALSAESTGRSVADEANEPAVVTGSTATASESETASEDAFEDQGICEVCGTLTHDLSSFNGQLRCADCRTV